MFSIWLESRLELAAALALHKQLGEVGTQRQRVIEHVAGRWRGITGENEVIEYPFLVCPFASDTRRCVVMGCRPHCCRPEAKVAIASMMIPNEKIGAIYAPGSRAQVTGRRVGRRSWRSLLWRGRPTARYGVGLVVHWLASSNIQAIKVRAVRGSRSGSGRPNVLPGRYAHCRSVWSSIGRRPTARLIVPIGASGIRAVRGSRSIWSTHCSMRVGRPLAGVVGEHRRSSIRGSVRDLVDTARGLGLVVLVGVIRGPARRSDGHRRLAPWRRQTRTPRWASSPPA